MTDVQKLIKYIAIALAVALIFVIFSSILSVLRIFTFIDDGDAVNDETTVYDVSQLITDLDFKISAAEFTVKTGDKLYIESNLKNLKVSENGSKLTVVEKTKVNYKVNKAFLTLYIPKDTLFNDVEIEAGAGKISLGEFSCRSLSLELGAGDFSADTLTVNDECTIHGGVGEFTVYSGTITDLEMEMGVGDMKLSSALYGTCDLSFGIGNAELTLTGTKEDYKLKIEKGIGSINLDGDKLTGDTTLGNGNTRIDIEGGIGNIDIKYGE